jgi:hypothetical protein
MPSLPNSTMSTSARPCRPGVACPVLPRPSEPCFNTCRTETSSSTTRMRRPYRVRVHPDGHGDSRSASRCNRRSSGFLYDAQQHFHQTGLDEDVVDANSVILSSSSCTAQPLGRRSVLRHVARSRPENPGVVKSVIAVSVRRDSDFRGRRATNSDRTGPQTLESHRPRYTGRPVFPRQSPATGSMRWAHIAVSH